MIDDSDFIFAQSLRGKKCFCWCHTNTLGTNLRRFPHLLVNYRNCDWDSTVLSVLAITCLTQNYASIDICTLKHTCDAVIWPSQHLPLSFLVSRHHPPPLYLLLFPLLSSFPPLPREHFSSASRWIRSALGWSWRMSSLKYFTCYQILTIGKKKNRCSHYRCYSIHNGRGLRGMTLSDHDKLDRYIFDKERNSQQQERQLWRRATSSDECKLASKIWVWERVNECVKNMFFWGSLRHNSWILCIWNPIILGTYLFYAYYVHGWTTSWRQWTPCYLSSPSSGLLCE